MQIVLLDLEGVLVPEIWINVADSTGIEALKRTTRDEPNYSKLMKERLETLRRHNVTIRDIQKIIAHISPLEGAVDFLRRLRAESQFIIVSDTFTQFARPIMEMLEFPTLFCNELVIDSKGFIRNFVLRQKRGEGKGAVVRALQSLNYTVFACGDSYNDLPMIECADRSCFFRPPETIRREYSEYPFFSSYNDLLALIMYGSSPAHE